MQGGGTRRFGGGKGEPPVSAHRSKHLVSESLNDGADIDFSDEGRAAVSGIRGATNRTP